MTLQAVLLDSSVYISALRRGRDAALALRPLISQTALWLSSVVLEELYAGAFGPDLDLLERWERDFDKAERILVPNLQDWAQSGRALSKLAGDYGYEEIGRGRLTNDALIATSAGRTGIRVITANANDFARLSEFVDFEWQPTV
ncbi:MAG: type II toxin-antitoxin system VapC family toxin [Terriglobales bacterium]